MYNIAKNLNTTVPELKQLNNLTTNTISIDQQLKIPNKTRNTYTVKKGDTLYQIALKNNTTIDKIKKLNNLSNDILTIGQTLLLPTTEILEIPTTNKTYTVEKGDTLYSLAKKYNTTVSKVKALNNLSNNTLSIGQVLKIPTTQLIEIPTTTTTYTIQPGDTLYSLAKEYNTTINNIKTLNNLTTNNLIIGQNILLP